MLCFYTSYSVGEITDCCDYPLLTQITWFCSCFKSLLPTMHFPVFHPAYCLPQPPLCNTWTSTILLPSACCLSWALLWHWLLLCLLPALTSVRITSCCLIPFCLLNQAILLLWPLSVSLLQSGQGPLGSLAHHSLLVTLVKTKLSLIFCAPRDPHARVITCNTNLNIQGAWQLVYSALVTNICEPAFSRKVTTL